MAEAEVAVAGTEADTETEAEEAQAAVARPGLPTHTQVEPSPPRMAGPAVAPQGAGAAVADGAGRQFAQGLRTLSKGPPPEWLPVEVED